MCASPALSVEEYVDIGAAKMAKAADSVHSDMPKLIDKAHERYERGYIDQKLRGGRKICRF
jgi:hypothetical protein